MEHNKVAQSVGGTLYVVATPIGNLDDLSARALKTLHEVELIACEDTRRTAQLCAHFAIKTPLLALHDHNEKQAAPSLVHKLRAGAQIALVSDAGTPLISDPGFKLVQLAAQAQLNVVPVPGACAFVSALSAAGLATDRFRFEGFLPHKASGRIKELEELAADAATLVFYESKHRILETLALMEQVLGNRECTVARELTKTFEQFYRGSISAVASQLQADEKNQLGEFVVIVEGNPNPPSIATRLEQTLFERLLRELPPKKAAQITADITGADKKTLYQQAIERQK